VWLESPTVTSSQGPTEVIIRGDGVGTPPRLGRGGEVHFARRHRHLIAIAEKARNHTKTETAMWVANAGQAVAWIPSLKPGCIESP
jgi:hypothetical protein